MSFNNKSVTDWFDTYLEYNPIQDKKTETTKSTKSIIDALDTIIISEKTEWKDLVDEVLKTIGKESISFDAKKAPYDEDSTVIADRDAAEIWQKIEKMDIGFRRYLTEYVGTHLKTYLSAIFENLKCQNGNKGKKELKYFIAVFGLTEVLSEDMLAWIILRHADCVGGAVGNLQQQLAQAGAIDKASRKTVFRIMFALQISLDDARDWLRYGLGGDDFDPRRLREVIYCYALANNIHYKKKSENGFSVEVMLRIAENEIINIIFKDDSQKIRGILQPNQNDNAFTKGLKRKIAAKITEPREIVHVIVGCAIFSLPEAQRVTVLSFISKEQEFFNYCRYIYNLYIYEDIYDDNIKHKYDELDNQSVINMAAKWIENIPFDNTEETETYEMLIREVLADLERNVEDFIQYYVQNDYLYEQRDISLSRSDHIHELIDSVMEQVNDYLENYNGNDDCNINSMQELSFFLEGIESDKGLIDRGIISSDRFFGDHLKNLTKIADVKFHRSDFVRLYFLRNACEKMMNKEYSSNNFKMDLDLIMGTLRYSGYNEYNPLDVLLCRCLDTEQPIETYQAILNCPIEN